MSNKKAILMKNFANLAIAVVCIFILIYFTYQLYGIFTKKTALEQARGSLNKIIAKTEGLGEGDKREVLITAPKEWYIVANEKQLCICGDRASCDKTGVCKEIDSEIFLMGAIVGKNEDVATYQIGNFMSIEKPFILYIEKKEGKIIFYETKKQAENEIFFGLLDAEYNFLNQGKKQIGEQILFWYNSHNILAFRNNDARKALEENIKSYFSGYKYKIYVDLIPSGESTITTPRTRLYLFSVEAGGKNNMPEEIEFPILFIKNTKEDGKDLALVYYKK